jgi:hypothetical protein
MHTDELTAVKTVPKTATAARRAKLRRYRAVIPSFLIGAGALLDANVGVSSFVEDIACRRVCECISSPRAAVSWATSNSDRGEIPVLLS